MHGAMLRGGAMMTSAGVALSTIAEANCRPVAAVASQRCPRRNLSEEIGQEPPRGASNLNLDEPPSVLEVSQVPANDVNVVGRVVLPKEANGQLGEEDAEWCCLGAPVARTQHECHAQAGAFRELLEFRTETAKLRAETAEFQAKLRAEAAEARRKTADLGAEIATLDRLIRMLTDRFDLWPFIVFFIVFNLIMWGYSVCFLPLMDGIDRETREIESLRDDNKSLRDGLRSLTDMVGKCPARYR